MEPLIPPAAIFFIGALLIPLFKGTVKKIFILIVPLVSILHMFSIGQYVGWRHEFLDFELILIYADRLSLFMGSIFVIMALLVTIYNLNLKKDSDHMVSFIYMGCALGVVFAGDLFTFIIFWKILPVASVILIFLKRDEKSLNAGYRYFLMHIIGSSILLAGIIANYMHTGSISMNIMGASFYELIPMIIIIGIGFKAAFIPVHTWLPDSYPSAHFGTSVILSVFSTKVAIYALARLVPGAEVLAYMGALMAIYGVTFALIQNDIRKSLSYIIISSVGFMVAGIGIGTPLSIDGGLLHSVNSMLYMSLLFMSAGAIIYQINKQKFTELGSVSKLMPITTICTIIALLSLAGMPLFNGFISKSIIYEAAYFNEIIYLTLKISSFATFLFIFKFIYFVFLRHKWDLNPHDERKAFDSISHTMAIPMIFIAFLCILIGIYPNIITNYLPNYSEFKFSFDKMMGSFYILTMGGIAFIFNGKIFKKNLFIPRKINAIDFDYLYINLAHVFIWICKNPVVLFSVFVDLFYAKLASIFTWICKNPVVFFSAFIDMLFVKIASTFTWFCKNPVMIFSIFIDLLYVKITFVFIWFCKVPMSFFNIKVNLKPLKKEHIFKDKVSKFIKAFESKKAFKIKNIYGMDLCSINIEQFSMRASEKIEKIEHEKIMLSDMNISFSMLLVIIMLGILLAYTALVRIM